MQSTIFLLTVNCLLKCLIFEFFLDLRVKEKRHDKSKEHFNYFFDI